MKFFSKIKYPLLKLIDISGFKVFDPVVRLLYNEEPQKQTREELEAKAKDLQAESAKVAEEVATEMDAKIAPVKERLDEHKAEIKKSKVARKVEVATLSEKLVAGEAKPEDLVALLEKHNSLADEEKDATKVINDELSFIRDNPPERLKEAQLAANKMADEVQHYKKRISYLTTGNKEQKIEALNEKAETATAALAATSDPSDAAKQAKSVVSNTEKVESTSEQKYPRAATIFWQTWRSIATVFVGLAFLQTNPAMIFSACTVAMCALWPALVNTALGVSAIDKDHLNVAKVLRLGFWSRLFKIIIPSSLPLVFAGLRISLGVGWMVLIAAEALSSSDGLGKFVWDEYQNGSSASFANIILACFVVGIIGFILDRFMIILQRLVSFDDGSATA